MQPYHGHIHPSESIHPHALTEELAVSQDLLLEASRHSMQPYHGHVHPTGSIHPPALTEELAVSLDLLLEADILHFILSRFSI